MRTRLQYKLTNEYPWVGTSNEGPVHLIEFTGQNPNGHPLSNNVVACSNTFNSRTFKWLAEKYREIQEYDTMKVD